MKRILRILCLLTLGLSWAVSAPAATYTDGSATFTVTLSEIPGNYQNVHVDAVWVTDATGRFIKTLRRDAGSRANYLTQWNAARSGYSGVDGYSGATAPNYTDTRYNPITVTWNSRDTNNVLLADGTYRFYVEFTDRNGQGPYTTNGHSFVKGPNPVDTTLPSQPYMSNLRITWTPVITHDIAVQSISPAVGYPDTNVAVRVSVTNLTSFAESFTVTLSNVTTASLLGSQAVGPLAGNTATTVTFTWDTTGVATGDYLLHAVAGPVTDELSVADNQRDSILTIRHPQHDVAVERINAPLYIQPNTASNVTVTAANPGDFTESFGLILGDATDARVLGSNYVANLPAFGTRNVNFTFSTAGSSTGYHTLVAVALPVAGDADLQNNTNTTVLAVAPGVETRTLVARGSVWRYHDQGLDLTATPWKLSDYYDGFWSAGAAPLGYGQSNITTTNVFGASDNKYPTYYYRQKFYVDFPPLSLELRLRRDDGAVLHFNGAEGFRTNLPPGPVTYDTWADVTVSGTAQYTYDTNLLATTNAVVGENVLAAEVHQSSGTSSDIAFDLELVAVWPRFTLTQDVAAVAVVPSGDALVGDQMTVSVTLTNRGNATETVNVYVRDLTTGQTIGWQVITNLVAGGSTVAVIPWRTSGTVVGDHTLEACTVIGGVTNLVGMATGTAVIAGSGLGLNAVNTAGAIGGYCSALAVTTNNLLLLGAGAALEIFDRANPAAPVKRGAVRLPGLIEDIFVLGANAYLACGDAGVHLVDISDPVAPVHRNSFDSSGHASGVYANPNFLYVADGTGGLRILNITNLAAPLMLGSFYTDGPARAISVTGPVAYVLDAHKGLTIVHVANPYNPIRRSTCHVFDSGQALAVAGSLFYAVDGSGKLWILSVASPSAPTLITNLQLNAVGRSVAVSGTTVYIAAGDAGLLTVSAATPTAPVIVATNVTPGQATDVAVSGSTAYVADGFAGFQVYDLSVPTAPALLGDFAVAARGADVVVQDGLACVAAGEAGLRIFSLTNPAAPALLGVYAGAANARSLAISGGVAYVGDGPDGLRLVSVADPANPALLGTFVNTNLGYIRGVAAAGNQVVVTDGRKLCLLDAADPAHPALTGTYDAPAFAFALAASADNAFAACGDYGLLILDLTAGLSLVGSYDTPGYATGVSVSGTNAFVADGGRGWLMLDISSPGSPALVKSSSTEGPVTDIAAAGMAAALASGARTARVVDVSTPLTPVPQGTFGPLVRAISVATDGRVTVVAEDEAGLAIGDISGDVDRDGLPDAWEQQIVDADPDDSIVTIHDVLPEGDFDRDGASNYAEFLAGTLPTSAASVFLAAVQASPDGSTATIRWNSMAGRQYTIYKSTNLLTGFSVLLENVPATPPVNSHDDTVTSAAAFYIIGVR